MIHTKGDTNYAVALAIRRVCEAIIRDERSVLPVSALLAGEYGLEDVYLGIQSIIGAGGNPVWSSTFSGRRTGIVHGIREETEGHH